MKSDKYAERLIKLRKEHGYTQKEVAQKVGISESTYRNYERGHVPSIKNERKLAEIFTCNINWLRTGEGNPYIDDIERSQYIVETFPYSLSMLEGTRETEKNAPVIPTAPEESLRKIETFGDPFFRYSVQTFLNIMVGVIEERQQTQYLARRLSSALKEIDTLKKQIRRLEGKEIDKENGKD
jgi:transcriptional regulator with XRE-family HTH domain